MIYLFDSKGKHIANFHDGQLHATGGKNIGHFLPAYNIFIDMHGKYLGEIIFNNRLMYNLYNNYGRTNFGIYGNYGNIGNYGNPGNYGSIGTVNGYKDIDLLKLI